MARRRTASRKNFERYPNVYARTSDTWTTRYYQRKTRPNFSLLGLNTANDDFHKPEGSSPYLTNVRYMGEREEDQRAQLMSRKGAKLNNPMGEDSFLRNVSEGDTYIPIREGEARQWEFLHNKKLTGVQFILMNEERATGFFKVSIRDPQTFVEYASAVVDAETISPLRFTSYSLHLIKTVIPSRLVARIELLDDVDNSEVNHDNMPVDARPKRAIKVLAVRSGKHQKANYQLPNVDGVLREKPYEFVEDNGTPLMGTLINDWEGMLRGHPFTSGGRKYIVFPVKHDGFIELYKTDRLTNQTTFVTNKVNVKAKAVRFAQAEGFMYYVDGISALQRINLTTFEVETVVPKASEVQSGGSVDGIKPKVGASLILFLQNRIYLSGFADDPNLVLVSLIDGTKPRFEQYADRFYSPDQAPQLSAGNPITALDTVSDLVVVFREQDLSLYTSGSGYEAGGASQVTPEGAALGVLNQEAVCRSQNNLYFYNPVEGMVRFGGSLNRNVSLDIENLHKRIKHPENIFMSYHNKRVRMFFSYNDTKPDSCLYYYTELEGRLPWYLDTNTPVLWAVGDKKTGQIYAMHSQVASVMELETQFTDFDTYIEMEYHLQFQAPSDVSGEAFIRRTHVHVLANSTHSLYIGVDTDHKDKPIVYRRYVPGTVDSEINPDAVFSQTAEAGIAVISIPMYLRCRRYQIRLKRYCYKDVAEILGAAVEYSDKEPI